MTLTVHELIAGMVPPLNVRIVAPALGAQAGRPPQVVVAAGVEATCNPKGSVSLNVTPVNGIEFEFARVNLNVEVPLTAMGLDKKAFVIVGAAGVEQPVKVTLSKLISFPLEVAFAPYP